MAVRVVHLETRDRRRVGSVFHEVRQFEFHLVVVGL